MNLSWIFKYQVHLASVRPRTAYHILYTNSQSTHLENFVAISLGAEKWEKGLLLCFSIGKKREKRAKQKPFACQKFLRAVVIKCCQNMAFQLQ